MHTPLKDDFVSKLHLKKETLLPIHVYRKVILFHNDFNKINEKFISLNTFLNVPDNRFSLVGKHRTCEEKSNYRITYS